jgi:hypothetical protein
MSDSESLLSNNCKLDSRPDSLGDMFSGLFGIAKMKMGFLIFFIFMLFNTTLFIEYILVKFPNAVDDVSQPTDRGICIVGMLLTMCYIILDILVQHQII